VRPGVDLRRGVVYRTPDYTTQKSFDLLPGSKRKSLHCGGQGFPLATLPTGVCKHLLGKFVLPLPILAPIFLLYETLREHPVASVATIGASAHRKERKYLAT